MRTGRDVELCAATVITKKLCLSLIAHRTHLGEISLVWQTESRDQHQTPKAAPDAGSQSVSLAAPLRRYGLASPACARFTGQDPAEKHVSLTRCGWLPSPVLFRRGLQRSRMCSGSQSGLHSRLQSWRVSRGLPVVAASRCEKRGWPGKAHRRLTIR